MKKILMLVAGAMLVVGIAGCVSNTNQGEVASSQGSSGAAQSSESSAMVGVPNPWHDVASAEEAGKGAGLGSFSVRDSITVGDVTIPASHFSYMEGIAQADYELSGQKVTVRKGADMTAQELAGDYNEYPKSWEQNIKGLSVTCLGESEGQAQHLEWTVDSDVYAVVCTAEDGQEFALSEGDVQSLVTGIQ